MTCACDHGDNPIMRFIDHFVTYTGGVDHFTSCCARCSMCKLPEQQAPVIESSNLQTEYVRFVMMEEIFPVHQQIGYDTHDIIIDLVVRFCRVRADFQIESILHCGQTACTCPDMITEAITVDKDELFQCGIQSLSI
jgi:hypothetical protein